MKIKVLFFANFRELLDCSNLSVELADDSSVADLCKKLAAKGEHWLSVFESPANTVKIALNQEMAELDSRIDDGDEVAFFPPVTGG